MWMNQDMVHLRFLYWWIYNYPMLNLCKQTKDWYRWQQINCFREEAPTKVQEKHAATILAVQQIITSIPTLNNILELLVRRWEVQLFLHVFYLFIQLLHPLVQVTKWMKVEIINDFLDIVQNVLEHFVGIFTSLQTPYKPVDLCSVIEQLIRLQHMHL